jgi:integrase
MAKAPGTIRQRGAGWNVIIRLNGTRHEYGPRGVDFLGTAKTRKEVEEWTWRKHTELREAAERSAKQKALGTPESVSFSGAVERFRAEHMATKAEGTRAAYEDTLRPALTFFEAEHGDPLMEEIRTPHVESYLSWRRVRRRSQRGKSSSRPLSERTLEKDRAVLHKLFAKSVKWGYTEVNPVAGSDRPTSDKYEPVILDDDEYERLLTECSASGPMLALYALLLGETGTRAYSEALMLRWEDVDLEEGFIEIRSGRDGHRTKSGKSRSVPMTARLAKALREHMAAYRLRTYGGQRSPWVFHHEVSRRKFYQAGERIGDFRTSFDAATERAKLPDGFRRHDLRHRRVTTWLGDGKSPALVQEAMGHSDPRVTDAYKHLARKHLRALVDEPESVESKRQAGA